MSQEFTEGDPAGLDEVLADYMRRLDEGEQVDQEAFIADHPELAAELRDCFSQAKAVERFARAATVTADVAGQATPRGALEVRCPSCHAPMDVAVDTTLTDLICTVCGSHFSLVNQHQETRMAPSLTKLGRFEIVERIGVGGFGSVWKARDNQLDRTVALKVPRQGGMTSEEQEKFFREARAAAQLRHPNIVSVHEVGRDGDLIYIVSEFVRGVNLSDWLTGQQFTSREAAELCTKIADALHHAHEQRVVHRDLKPANIMMDGDGEPHLMDFGLARREVGETTVTLDGQVLGTPAYMSPEQAQGEAHTADRRSDVYSLGVILFQLLTGELPFRGNARMIMHQILNDEPVPPRSLNRNIPRDLEVITMKCLEKNPERRFASAQELAEDLTRFLLGHSIKSRPVGTIDRAWRWCKRKPTAATLLFVLATVAVVAPIVAVWQSLIIQRATRDRASRDRAFYVANLSLANQLWSEGRTDDALAALEACPEKLRNCEFRLLNSLYRRAPNVLLKQNSSIPQVSMIDQSKLAFITYDGRVTVFDSDKNQMVKSLREQRGTCDLALHPNRTTAVIATDDGMMRVLSIPELLDQHPEIPAFDRIDPLNAEVRFSPKGKYFAALGNDQIDGIQHCVIKVWSTDNWEVCFNHILAEDSEATDLRFSADGKQLFFCTDDGYLVRWNFVEDKLKQSARVAMDEFTCLEVSHDGEFVVAGNYDGRIYWFDTGGLEISHRHFGQAHDDAIWCLAFDKRDSLLVSASADRQVKVWDLSTGMLANTIRGNNSSVVSIALDENADRLFLGTLNGNLKTSPVFDSVGWKSLRLGATLASVAIDDACELIAAASDHGRILLWNQSGELVKSIEIGREGPGKTDEIGANDIALSRDGRMLVAGGDDGRLYIWDTRTFTCTKTAATIGEIECVAISTDGTMIAGGGNESVPVVQIWDRSGKQTAVLPKRHSETINSIAFSRDNQFIAAGDEAGVLTIWSVESGDVFREHRIGSTINQLVFMHNHPALVAGCDDYSILMWDWEEDKIQKFTSASEYNIAVESTLDDTRILSGGSDRSIAFWDPISGEQVFRTQVHDDYVYELILTGNGQLLLSADRSGLIKLWSMAPPHGPRTKEATRTDIRQNRLD